MGHALGIALSDGVATARLNNLAVHQMKERMGYNHGHGLCWYLLILSLILSSHLLYAYIS
jgi:hypothetical protein